MVGRKAQAAHQSHCGGAAKDGRAHVTGLYSEKSGKTYDATVVMEDTGQYVNFKLEFDRQKGGGK